MMMVKNDDVGGAGPRLRPGGPVGWSPANDDGLAHPTIQAQMCVIAHLSTPCAFRESTAII